MIIKELKLVIAFGALEAIIGSVAGYVYLENYHGEGDLNQSILEFYLTLNCIFFLATALPGTINIGLLKTWNKLLPSILLSIGLGIAFLIIYSMAFSFLTYTLNIRLAPLFFPLLGFIIGFNYGLLKRNALTNSS